ncbi:MAG: Unknown protein [uncultured Sulfurovum sp.]|uniref:DUF1835 domain-containing protein n=1 Tax=uncultured Sulfurovum sp. TaxID=269237 RepID=A0A6S6TJ63_9BACT|nr:MAG: Unknown protein [uncultured Sulfurovum sp.]
MSKVLNIINGDACINMLKEANMQGDFLAWKDFLHEGPVPTHLSLTELSKVRARFIADFGLGTFDEIYLDFLQRNKTLLNYQLYDKIILWFEHDLYDQLQLLQILSWFSEQNLDTITLTLICTNNYLGESSPQQLKKLLRYEVPIVDKHLHLAKEAWLSFGKENPQEFSQLLNRSTAILPFLKAAIFRMLEEYPSTKYGLSRSEYQALLIISNGINNKIDIFIKYQSFEERKFMGDVIFWKILDTFEQYKVIKKHEEKFSITPLGKRLLEGEINWITLKNLQRHIGGVNVNNDNLWCWDMENKEIKKYYYSKTLKSLLKVK